jgi:hypothetical protein
MGVQVLFPLQQDILLPQKKSSRNLLHTPDISLASSLPVHSHKLGKSIKPYYFHKLLVCLKNYCWNFVLVKHMLAMAKNFKLLVERLFAALDSLLEKKEKPKPCLHSA